MIKKYTFWFKAAIALQLLTGVFHVLSFFSNPNPKNDTEAQLFDLMRSYSFDLGGGFHRSMEDLMNAFSVTFALLLFFSATLNIVLLKSHVSASAVKRVVLVNFFTYLVCFITMSLLTFLPPIICTGLIVVLLFASYILLRAEDGNQK